MTRSGDQATRRAVSSTGAPAAVGPYSQALIAGDLIFLSGQIPLDPATARMIDGSIDVLTRRVLDNIGAVLDASGSSFDRVVKTTVYLADMADFAAMNEVYATYFPEPFPARSTVQAAALPRNARIEIDVIATR
jgi:2-iminobutanoate/2-iminopropanoate deaminase